MEAADAHGVERQHVNYYVRKLVAEGVVRSEKSSASVPTPMQTSADESKDFASPYEKYCAAWRFAHEQAHVLGIRPAARATREKSGIA